MIDVGRFKRERFPGVPRRPAVNALMGGLYLLWLLLLLAPAFTVFGSLNDWDVDPWFLVFASVWVVFVALSWLPIRVFLALSAPVVAFGLVAIGAHSLRQIDAFELLGQWQQFTTAEVTAALGPYGWDLACLVIALVVLQLVLWRGAPLVTADRRCRLLSLALAVPLFALAPEGAWARVWPLNVALLAASSLPGGYGLDGEWVPNSSTRNPRGDGLRWEATRTAQPSMRETYVLVIGESVRSDFLDECQGTHRVRPLDHEFLVACDVTAGSDATHTSVPLLISRTMPGQRFRVPRDSSFIQAFKETGFETFWFGMHGQTLAWPDAEHQSYPDAAALDRQQLLPLLERALGSTATRRLIVLHANNAHAPYCGRYEPGAAPNQVDCRMLSGLPEPETLAIWRDAYANAVDESVRFLNAVRATLAGVDGAVFLIFSPDHGENLQDDHRGLYQHALRHPTRWDIQVPAVFWANNAWRTSKPQSWDLLKANVALPLMHADLVPTLLGAAGIRYADARDSVADLTSHLVPRRKRVVQTSLGAVTEWEALVRQAEP